MTDLASVLASYRGLYRPVIPFDLASGGHVVFDFTDSGSDFAHIDINDVAGFTERLFARIADAELPVGVGRYNEDRVIYRHSPLFDGEALFLSSAQATKNRPEPKDTDGIPWWPDAVLMASPLGSSTWPVAPLTRVP